MPHSLPVYPLDIDALKSTVKACEEQEYLEVAEREEWKEFFRQHEQRLAGQCDMCSTIRAEERLIVVPPQPRDRPETDEERKRRNEKLALRRAKQKQLKDHVNSDGHDGVRWWPLVRSAPTREEKVELHQQDNDIARRGSTRKRGTPGPELHHTPEGTTIEVSATIAMHLTAYLS